MDWLRIKWALLLITLKNKYLNYRFGKNWPRLRARIEKTNLGYIVTENKYFPTTDKEKDISLHIYKVESFINNII